MEFGCGERARGGAEHALGRGQQGGDAADQDLGVLVVGVGGERAVEKGGGAVQPQGEHELGGGGGVVDREGAVVVTLLDHRQEQSVHPDAPRVEQPVAQLEVLGLVQERDGGHRGVDALELPCRGELHHRLEALGARALVGLVGLFEGVEQLVRPPADHRDQEVGLGREVVVERALRDAGRLRDLLDRHGLVADVDAELQGGVHELVTPDRRVFGDACHGGLPSD